ncbi:MAG: ubiquinone/menaquinone biosynthesis methyltransferase, partial [Candidatus Udaeobacter sp.]
LQDILQTDEAVVLDLCCGTGDVYLDLRRVARAKVLGADFCFPMLVAAKEKAAARSFAPLLVDADALTLPFADESVHGISIAFGFRNLVNYEAGLVEFLRILKPGGRLVILEFSHPPGLFMKTAYGFYSRVLLPVIGGLVSGSGEAYTYLPSSIRKFPGASVLAELVRSVGFTRVEVQLLTGGIAALHVGTKEPRASLLAQ